MTTFNLLKGHNLNLSGKPSKKIIEVESPKYFAVHPNQYKGMKPKLLVKKGDTVNIGTPLFFDKTKDSVKVISPVNAVVEDIKLGKRRVVEKISLKKIGDKSESLVLDDLKSSTDFKSFLLNSGLWSLLRQRPFSKVPDPNITPRAIFLTLHQTAPFSIDLESIYGDCKKDIEKGIELLSTLTPGNVYLSLKKGSNFIENMDTSHAKINYFSGPHPSGNIGVQIHHIEPITSSEDLVYYLSIQDLISIVRTYKSGKYDLKKIISCGGEGVSSPSYYNVQRGACISEILGQVDTNKFRIISGDVLSGTTAKNDDAMNSFDEILSVIPELQEREFIGWALPGSSKYSLSSTFLSSAFGLGESSLRTGLNGSIRAIIPFGRWEKVLPMDIYPDFLVKSILAEDIDMMEKLGIYECDPEDFALCAFSCQSKIEVSKIISNGLELIEKEG